MSVVAMAEGAPQIGCVETEDGQVTCTITVGICSAGI